MPKSGCKYSAADTGLAVKVNPPTNILASDNSRIRLMTHGYHGKEPGVFGAAFGIGAYVVV